MMAIEINGKRYELFGGQADVDSREDLVQYIRKLEQQARAHPNRFENEMIPDYFEALARWLSDMDSTFRKFDEEVPTEPSWKLIALMLSAAQLYE